MKKNQRKSVKILVASGVNLDLLGKREPQIYGSHTLKDMERLVRKFFADFKRNDPQNLTKLVFVQTNSEEKFLKEFDKGYAGVVINAGAWSHTSLAIADRLRALGLPYVEVHVSDVSKREAFRQHSYLSDHAVAVVQGQGIRSYVAGLEKLLLYLEKKLKVHGGGR